jgi:hypothetical protein
MTERLFQITCVTTHDRLNTITQLIADQCSKFEVLELKPEPTTRRGRARGPAIASANHVLQTDKGRRAMAAVLAFMEPGKVYHYEDPELGQVIVPVGYAATTINPVLSAMVALGKIARIKRGHYARVA